ncbi:MAG: alpha/beta hydrolase [Actinobacteria bacterium]|nr:MAG: alpha/beta hydrolase [Actinomycetota bacterium]
MAWAFLAVTLVGACFTANAFRPVRIEPFTVPSFFAGWLTSELPLHHLAWQVVATVVFGALGAFRGWPGWAGLGIALAQWCGLIVLAVQAGRARGVVQVALDHGLGEGWPDRRDPAHEHAGAPERAHLGLVVPVPRPGPAVERLRDVAYWDDGTRRHRLDIYRPRRSVDGAPVFLYLHGGAWIFGDKREQGLPLMDYLASRGWVCVTANYGLSPRVAFPEHLVDCKRALSWVRGHIADYGGDPDFVVVGGGSAGGHLAALVALTPRDPEYQPGFEDADTSVAACVPFYGVYDFTNRDGLRGRGLGRLLERTVMKRSLEASRDAYERASPVDRINAGAPPFFVVHGANDTLVPAGEARHFVERLRRSSAAPVAYAELPGAQHAFEIFPSIRTAHVVAAVADFLAVVHAERGVATPPRDQPLRQTR